MILLNFILFDLLSFAYGRNKNCQDLERKLISHIHDTVRFVNLFKLRSLRCVKLSPSFLLDSINVTGKSQNNSIGIRSTSRLIKRNFWQKCLNQYWKETIFISPSNSILESYVVKLKNSGLSVYEGNDYKHFLMRFNKDLFDKKINLGCITAIEDLNSSVSVKHKNILSTEYIWTKPLNSFVSYSNSSQQNLYKSRLISKKIVGLPLFVLTNEYKRIILAESYRSSINSYIARQNYDIFAKKSLNNKNLYTGLFFVSPRDANEYANYITNICYKSTHSNSITTSITTPNFYYKLLDTWDSKVDFRLVPDLKEVSDLLCRYKYYSNVSFDSKQNVGSHYFQGQPVYFIEPVKLSRNNKIEYFNYLYPSSENSNTKYEAVFLNYKTAVDAWNKYRKKYRDYYLPLKPLIRVYNLESFLDTPIYTKNENKIIFIPSTQTYSYTKQYINNNFNGNKLIVHLVMNKLLYIRSLLHRALWSLTTRQPTSW